MEFDNPVILNRDGDSADNSDNFVPGNGNGDSVKTSSEHPKKEKKDKKKKEKETRYATLGEDPSSNEDEKDSAAITVTSSTSADKEIKSPIKTKKRQPFIFGSAKKDRQKSADPHDKSSEKPLKKEKHKIKLKKSSKLDIHDTKEEVPIFGVPLELAVERNKCHDGIALPLIVRQCIDYVESEGLMMEGIYRSSGVKSKVNKVKTAYNSSKSVNLADYDLPVVASVLKQFLRELPSPVLTDGLTPKFEKVSAETSPQRRIEGMKNLLNELPECNRLLIQWIFVHMAHVIERERFNKMTLQNVSIVLSPTMRISHRVLNCFFENSHILFDGVQLKRYIPPITSSNSLPETPEAIEEEIRKQDSYLADLHLQISSGAASKKTEEQIWEQQRIVTQLKRKLRTSKKDEDTVDHKPKFEPIDYDEELDFSLQTPETIAVKKAASAEEAAGSGNEAFKSPPLEPLKPEMAKPEISKAEVTSVKPEMTSSKPEIQPEITADKPEMAEEALEMNLKKDSDDSPEIIEPEVKVTVMVHREQEKAPETLPQEPKRKTSSGHVTVIKLNSTDKPDKPAESQPTPSKVAFMLPEASNPIPIKSGIPLLPPPPTSGKSREGRIPSSAILKPIPVSPIKSKSLPRGLPSNFEGFDSIDDKFPINTPVIDEEYMETRRLEFEYDELMALKSELLRRKQSERKEIEELKEEIASMQTLYQYRTYSVDSSESSSDEASDKEEEVEELAKILSDLIRENKELEETRMELQRKIQDERTACINLRVLIKLEQEKIRIKQQSINLM